mmetsp:Transcript_83364/g.210091  ORF Transcript_83364/g.210091 Transcript_83364/m.210091 type:complete len:231 (-) Transcript_83364:105-797(-)
MTSRHAGEFAFTSAVACVASQLCGSARPPTSNLHTSALPERAAMCNGDRSFVPSRRQGSAAKVSSTRVTSANPCIATKCRAVSPHAVRRLTSPWASTMSVQSREPVAWTEASAAAWIAPSPSQSTASRRLKPLKMSSEAQPNCSEPAAMCRGRRPFASGKLATKSLCCRIVLSTAPRRMTLAVGAWASRSIRKQSSWPSAAAKCRQVSASGPPRDSGTARASSSSRRHSP